MKKINYLLAVLVIGFAVVSCNKEKVDENFVNLKSAYVQSTSTPTSTGGIVPVILAVDKPRGGNVSCADVSQAFNNVALECGDKIDYIDEAQFEGAFPAWLNVNVTGIYISFHMDECMKINDKYYKVGAVIVKGSSAANVYFYPDGTLSDSHLAAPGDKYMVSNLTFCFVECESQLPEVVIALKSWYWGSYIDGVGSDYNYTVSTGTNVYTANDWCDVLGINYFPTTSSFALSENVGTVNIEVGWPGGVRSLIITVDLNEGMMLNSTYLYVGSLAGLGNLTTCPQYWNWPYNDLTIANSKVFTIPY